MRRLLTLALGTLMAAPAATLAAGGAVPPVQGGAGATAPGSPTGYVAVPAGRNTVVQAIWRPSAEVRRTRVLHGRWGVPGVTYDGATTGLSADRRMLVLAGLDSRGTHLLILDPRTLRVRDHIAFKGLAVVDAVSPDGRRLYLIRYRGSEYEVRAYDLRRHRLAPKPIVDPREPDEKMQGVPISRVMSADARWAYTLYGRPDGEPFVHALDTRRGTARCIDLEHLTMDDVASAKLTLDHGAVRVGRLARVDLTTFAILPHNAGGAAPRSAGGGGLPWWPFATAALAALAGWRLTRRSRAGARDLPVQ